MATRAAPERATLVVPAGAVSKYTQTADKLATAKGMTSGLAAVLDKGELRTILDDLEAIANADGDISDAEQEFITDTVRTPGSVRGAARPQSAKGCPYHDNRPPAETA